VLDENVTDLVDEKEIRKQCRWQLNSGRKNLKTREQMI
jgi:hypothetical protein